MSVDQHLESGWDGDGEREVSAVYVSIARARRRVVAGAATRLHGYCRDSGIVLIVPSRGGSIYRADALVAASRRPELHATAPEHRASGAGRDAQDRRGGGRGLEVQI